MSTGFIEALYSIGVALIAGFLIGAERERADSMRFAGARTFPLFALTGALGAMLGTWVLVAVSAVFGILIVAAYYRGSRGPEHAGMSTEAAALVTFCVGAICSSKQLGFTLSERLLLAMAIATVTLSLLSLRETLHGFIARISWDDIFATVKLLLLIVIVLPLLPNEDLGPWGSLNPRTIGLLVALIATIGFVGYIAIRILGLNRGVGITGVLGGIASSTAVALNFAGRARQDPIVVPASAVAIVLASGVMFIRVIVEIYLVAPALSWMAFWPLLGAAGTALIAGTVLYRRAPKEQLMSEKAFELNMRNPFSLLSAFNFAVLFVAVMMVSGASAHYFHNAGVYFSAALTALGSVHAASLFLAQMYASQKIGTEVALNAIGIALTFSVLFKICVAAFLGGRKLAIRVAPALLLALCVGALILRMM